MQLARTIALLLLAICAGLLWLGWCAYGVSWKALLVLVLGLIGLVTLVVGVTFAIAGANASPRPPQFRLSVLQSLRLWMREAFESGVLFCWGLLKGSAGIAGMAAPQTSSPHAPVLLIHGYINNDAAMHPLWKRLSDAGFQAFTQTMEPFLGGIDEYMEAIEARINLILAATGASQINVVVHSMGGLAMRAWAQRYAPAGDTRIGTLVTLGTPHHGTALAHYGPGRNALQMRLDSPWHAALPDATALPFRVVSIMTYDDNIVAPQSSSVLAGAKLVEFAGIGHLTLLIDARVFAAIRAEL